MQSFLKSAGAGLIAAVLTASSGAYAQSQATAAKEGTDLKIGHVRAEKAMESLQESVDRLRQASVLMLREEAGPKRKAAVEAAQDALIHAQRAMLDLPAEYRLADSKVREAKDWPMVMARLDEATEELKTAVDALQKQPAGTERNQAIQSMHKALDRTRQAMTELPEWTPETE